MYEHEIVELYRKNDDRFFCELEAHMTTFPNSCLIYLVAFECYKKYGNNLSKDIPIIIELVNENKRPSWTSTLLIVNERMKTHFE